MTPIETPRLKAKPPGSSRHACNTAAAAVLIGILAAYATTTTNNAGTRVERWRELLDETVEVCARINRRVSMCTTAAEHDRSTAHLHDPLISTPPLLESTSTWLLLGSTLLILYLQLKNARVI
ncbi:hypothetical protein [Hydrogenophaga sp.]|uniref:hypothetical protein n=1 Tax=Hydrogenophaga sp. TaxID=1904254 RepID=UPI002718D11F|nr:hypothetical protein [Hydrogenophaga sp.]MDO9436086.1 hypothetical protein [Hydrogenophaga sp.]